MNQELSAVISPLREKIADMGLFSVHFGTLQELKASRPCAFVYVLRCRNGSMAAKIRRGKRSSSSSALASDP